MAILEPAMVMALALQASPSVAPDTILAFATHESGLNTLAVHDNSTGRSYQPLTSAEAISISRSLIGADHSVDLGIMQINSANLPRFGLSYRHAFEPALSIRMGAKILEEAWDRCKGPPLHRMKCAAQIYNSGSASGAPQYANGLIHRAAQLVPSITKIITDFPEAASEGADTRLNTGAPAKLTTKEISLTPAEVSQSSCEAPRSDVWGQQACREAAAQAPHTGDNQ